ncbi:outer membrane protein assembly factor BamB family protein [Anaeromyxobacter oryzisoli]|uniref:outer membrane protein assembly factor BamB family protein n=1 Tax=Anaeromyxobacter oryzisoli TaxID=2925408 RepID=UPI001F59A5F1|nr:PQQ-binding-like beta-propeller repeat protein [Anaeromyxobacter sp. SG63]
MIRIRTGTAWRHDPRLRAMLGPARAAGRTAARTIVDALAIEVDGIDLTAGRAEGPLLPSLEALLRAVARVLGGAPHATVAFPDGGLELLVRRRGASALLTIVSVARPSRVLARDVEVELEALSAAALAAAADFCRQLARIAPDATRGARRLQAAARDLRRTGPALPRVPSAEVRRERPHAGRAGPVACAFELHEDDALLAYEGGRPDLGSLLAPGTVTIRAADGAEIVALPGFPFLLLRDLNGLSRGILDALQRGEREYAGTLARAGRAAALTLRLDLVAGRISAGGPATPCPPLDLVRAVSGAALELGRTARARNPRQAENGFLLELEASAAERLALAEELAAGDRPGATAAPGRAPRRLRALSQEPLGPGRLRRLGFQRRLALDVGRPAGAGLLAAGRTLVAAGEDGLAAIDPAGAEVRWRAEGCDLAAVVPGAVVAVRGDRVTARALRDGHPLWTVPLPGGAPSAAIALARGPWALAGHGALTGLDPATGGVLWRFAPPAAGALRVRGFGGIAAVAAGTGFLYGVDAAGRVAWRVRGPGAFLGPPAAAAGACVAAAEVGAGAAVLAVDPASGVRLWEAPLDVLPTAPPLAWGARVVVGGTVAGDPAVTVLQRTGAPAWTVAPDLRGAPRLAVAGPLLAIQDASGALVALARDGEVRWTRPASPGVPPPAPAAPVSTRGLLLAAGDGIACLDARTGELLGTIPGVAPVRLFADDALRIVAMDADGVVSVLTLTTHLSVV